MSVVPFPVIRFDQRRANEAFAVYSTMLASERSNPALRRNEAWNALRDEAYRRFERQFGATK